MKIHTSPEGAALRQDDVATLNRMANSAKFGITKEDADYMRGLLESIISNDYE